MTGWRATFGLQRAALVGGVGLALGVVLGVPALSVLAAPFVVHAVLARLARPDRERLPRPSRRADQEVLHEGRSTTSRLEIGSAQDVEYATRVLAPVPYVELAPRSGVTGAVLAPAASSREASGPPVRMRAERWGLPVLGAESVLLTAAWAGYRFGPVDLDGTTTRVLPVAPRVHGRAVIARPRGLVGRHPAQRAGAGSDLGEIRPFRPGDRRGRIHWRASNRSGELHVVASPGEQDAGVLLVLDALGDHGRSGGVGGAASSLDVAVRAASALAADPLGAGDRVALQVLGAEGVAVAPGSGARHRRALQDTLIRARPGASADRSDPAVAPLRGISLVVVLSPMLDPAVIATVAGCSAPGRSVVCLDTLPETVTMVCPDDVDREVADLAWRMRLLEREQVRAELSGRGCPVLAWHGAGTLDAALRLVPR